MINDGCGGGSRDDDDSSSSSSSSSQTTTGIISLIEEESSMEAMSRQPSCSPALTAVTNSSSLPQQGSTFLSLPSSSMNKQARTKDIISLNTFPSEEGGGKTKGVRMSETYPERRKKSLVSSSSSSSSRKMIASRQTVVVVGGLSHGSHNNFSINRKGRTRRTEFEGQHHHRVSSLTVEKRLDSKGVGSTKKTKAATRRIPVGKTHICSGEAKESELEQKMEDDSPCEKAKSRVFRGSDKSLSVTAASLDASSSGVKRMKSPTHCRSLQRGDREGEDIGEISQTCSAGGVSPLTTTRGGAQQQHQSAMMNRGEGGRELNHRERDQPDEKLQQNNSTPGVMTASSTTTTTASSYSITSTTTTGVVTRPSLQQQRGRKAQGGTGKGSRLSGGGLNTKTSTAGVVRQAQPQPQPLAQLHDQQRRKKKQGGGKYRRTETRPYAE